MKQQEKPLRNHPDHVQELPSLVVYLVVVDHFYYIKGGLPIEIWSFLGIPGSYSGMVCIPMNLSLIKAKKFYHIKKDVKSPFLVRISDPIQDSSASIEREVISVWPDLHELRNNKVCDFTIGIHSFDFEMVLFWIFQNSMIFYRVCYPNWTPIVE